MRNLILAAVISLVALLPAAGQAQQPAPRSGDMFGLSSSQVVAIGVGAVGGVIVAEAVVVGLPIWAGAVAGGLVGNWWHSQQVEEMRTTAGRRAAALADEAKLYLISVGDYATSTAEAWTPGWLTRGTE